MHRSAPFDFVVARAAEAMQAVELAQRGGTVLGYQETTLTEELLLRIWMSANNSSPRRWNMSPPLHVDVRQFTQRQEAVTGADWDWWFVSTKSRVTDPEKASYTGIGLRLQAKKASAQRASVSSAQYKGADRLAGAPSPTNPNPPRQIDQLIKSCINDQMWPGYIFYNPFFENTVPPKRTCENCVRQTVSAQGVLPGRVPYPINPIASGAIVVASALDVFALLAKKQTLTPDVIAAISQPLACLVGCSAHSGDPRLAVVVARTLASGGPSPGATYFPLEPREVPDYVAQIASTITLTDQPVRTMERPPSVSEAVAGLVVLVDEGTPE